MNHTQEDASFGAGVAAVFAGSIALVKLVLYGWTGSYLIALSALDSSIDVGMSLINRKVIRFARQRKDADHPYGHGKAESVAALIQGILILGSSLLVLFSSFRVFFSAASSADEHRVISVVHWQAAFFIVTGLLSAVLTSYLMRKGKKYNSPALIADAKHYQADFFSNTGTGLSLLFVLHFQVWWLDPLIAACFSIVIAIAGLKLLNASLDDLMDKDLGLEIKRKLVRQVLNLDSRILDVHNLRGRRMGHRYSFDFHITLPTTLSFLEVHEIVEKVEEELEKHFEADAVIHADPDCLGTQHDTLSKLS